LDQHGDDSTTAVESDNFTVDDGDDVPIDIDFPDSSFL
jgi:hypothetical protein